jgi:Fe-S cluster assembly protein SufD
MSITNVEKNINSDILNNLASHADRFPAIKPARLKALETLRQNGLPSNKHEEYRYTPLAKALEKIEVQAYDTPFPNVADETGDLFLPGKNAYTITLVNGFYKPELSTAIKIGGLTVRLLDDVVKNSPEIVNRYLDSFSEASGDPFTTWNIAGWTSGVFISVDDRVVIETPIIIYNLIDARNAPVLNVLRNLIVVGKSSSVKVIQKVNSIGDHPHFMNTVTEAIVSENAGLDHYAIQNDKGEHHQFNRTHILQSNSSRVNTFTFSLDGKIVRNNLQLSLNGEGCESHMYGLYLLNGESLVDNHTVADHQKPNSFSNELYKGIIDDRAKGVFNGKIYVRPNAQKTNAFQSNRNILLSDSAKVNTKPQLEIWADDVKCSHGCTTGQLDEEALFYLQTRGITKADAQAMLLYAFAGEVINNVTIPEIREYLERLISQRLHQTN